MSFPTFTHPPRAQTEAGLLDNILGWVGLGVEVKVKVGGEELVVEAAEEEAEELPAEAEAEPPHPVDGEVPAEDADPVDGEVQDESIEEPEAIPEDSKPPADEL